MLKLYHNPLSFNPRRVWVLLLEKNLEFESIFLTLDGDQFQPEFQELNPFSHVPVLVDDDFTLIESLAILDYLDHQYPTPSFTPTDAKSIGIMRMLELVTINELLPATLPFLRQLVGLPELPNQSLETAHHKISKIYNFYQSYLADHPYLIGETITLADIVVGTVVPSLVLFNISLDPYPKLKTWCEMLMQRDSWQQTVPKPELIEKAIPGLKARLEKM